MKTNTKLTIVLILILVVSLVSFTGCSGKTEDDSSSKETSQSNQTLIIQDDTWEGVDLFQVSYWTDMQCLIADPILEKNPDTGAVMPGIASESKWSEDGLTWTLTFPEGMKYSTGEQVEPEDFIASVEYGLETSPYADGYKSIESMEIDGRNVIIHLSKYQADMQYNFQSCFVGLMDKDELDNMSADEKLWGCHPYGAYYVDEYQPGAYVIIKANEGYKTNNPMLQNQGSSPVKTVKIVFTGESFTFAQGVKNGDYDVLSMVPSEYYEELKNADNIDMFEAYGAEVNYAEINLKDPLFQDINVRKAIVHAISRENLGSYMSDFEKPAYSLILRKCLNYSDEAVEYYNENYGYDVELSKKLLTDAGWTDTDNDGFVDKNGENFQFEFDCRDTETPKKVAQSMQIDLKAIGIDMQIKTQNWSYVNQDVVDGNFQMAYLGLGWSEPFLLVDNFCNRNPEYTNPDPENYNAMVEKARRTVDYDEITTQITEIQKTLFDYCTIIPLVDNNGYRCWRSEIKGIVHTPTGGFYLGDVVTDENGNFRSIQ
jgi:ABC-type transport system substrate-binding protein